MHPRAKVSPETCKFRRHGCPLAKSCQCQTHSINLHVRGVSDVARTVIRSNTCMDETDEAAGRGSEAEKPPGADLPSIARGATPGHERDTARAMELRAASRLRADHLGASRAAFRLRFDRVVACCPRSTRHRGSHWSSPGAAVRRTLEQPSVGASSSMPPDIVRLLWALAQAP